MDLSKITIEPRIRNGWQAGDLGFAMARQWFLPLWMLWAVPSGITLAVLSLVGGKYSWLALMVVWWLKPIWERLPLLYLSRALFSEYPPLKSLLGQFFSIAKTDFFAAILWRRFSPSRSFDLPLTVLEGLKGKARAQRLTGLHQTYGNAALWMTIVCVHIETILMLGVWAIALLLLPVEFQEQFFDFFVAEAEEYSLLSNVLTWLVMGAMAPFYVAGGFSLYIGRRIELEAWDVEIRFRHMLEQHQANVSVTPRRKLPKAIIALVPFLLITFGSFTATDVRAQTDSAQETNNAVVEQYYDALNESSFARQSKDNILDVLSSEDFNRYELKEGYRFKPLDVEDPEFNEEDWGFLKTLIEWLLAIWEVFEALSSAFGTLAGALEIMFWALLIGIVVYIIYRYRNGLMAMFRYRPAIQTEQRQEPEVLFGLDVRRDSIPKDVIAQVKQLWLAGQSREAVSLLYRATLSHLIHEFSFEFFDGYTEQECATVVEASVAARETTNTHQNLPEYMWKLTRIWQSIAYAHRVPSEDQVIALCRQWPQFFELADAKPTGERQ
ncbi:DUF4129 domain-containing protein [Aurantivibrio plasticivorans]